MSRHPQRKGFKHRKRKPKMSKEELVAALDALRPEWTPFVRIPDEVAKTVGASKGYENSRYLVWVYLPGNPRSGNDWNRYHPDEDTEFPRWTHLSIKSHDKCHSAHDWRDLQRIKNELIGPEAEAIELYPSMRRLRDAANQFHLWVIEPEEGKTYAETQIPVGWPSPEVSDKATAEALFPKSRQRAFEDGFMKGNEDLLDDLDDLRERALQIKRAGGNLAEALKEAGARLDDD